jgi:hypothetical protein
MELSFQPSLANAPEEVMGKPVFGFVSPLRPHGLSANDFHS